MSDGIGNAIGDAIRQGIAQAITYRIGDAMTLENATPFVPLFPCPPPSHRLSASHRCFGGSEVASPEPTAPVPCSAFGEIRRWGR